jgi:hypothetical protein
MAAVSPHKFSADTPELRLVARHAGIRAARLAAGINDPQHLSMHVTPKEMDRLGQNAIAYYGVWPRVQQAIDTYLQGRKP